MAQFFGTCLQFSAADTWVAFVIATNLWRWNPFQLEGLFRPPVATPLQITLSIFSNQGFP